MFRNAVLTVMLLATGALTIACRPSASDAPLAAKANVEPSVPDRETAAAFAPSGVADGQASKPDVVLPPEACTLQGGWDFFQQFVESADVRRAYSTLDLKAGLTADAVAAHPQFDGFQIGLVDSRWVLVNPAVDPAEYPRASLKSALQGNTFTIDYTQARFSNDDETVETYGETARYTFEFIDGCWRLVSQSPAP